MQYVYVFVVNHFFLFFLFGGCEFDTHSGTEIFSFSLSGKKIKHGIEFCHLKKCLETKRKPNFSIFSSGKLLKGRGIYPLELCEKFIIHLTKVALGVLCFHPFSYVPLIRPSLEFALYYCFTEQGMVLTYERFTIQCLNIVKGILQCVEYKLPKANEPVKEPCEFFFLFRLSY